MFQFYAAAALVLQLALVGAQSSGVLTSDTYFYGDSPKVAPPRTGSGTGNWTESYTKAKAFVAKLTLDEKLNLTAGAPAPVGCTGNVPALPRLGFPGMCLTDNGNGVRGSDFVSGYPPGIHVAATWNKDLAYARGYHLGGEFRTKGVNVALGPVVGPIGRIAKGGRTWEGFGPDPYLSGALVGPTVAGIQSNGVIASTKHFIANEQETNRNPGANGSQPIEAVSSNIDDKTMHELYLWPFVDAVHAGSGNIMCNYNRVNNSYGCQNSKTLNGLLKTELGFQGWVVSDWNAQRSGVASAISGLDMTMPTPGNWGSQLKEAVQNGSVPEWRLNDMVTRIIATWYQLGQDSDNYPAPGVGLSNDLQAPHKTVNARRKESKQTLLQSAIEGHVLVKNVKNALPLRQPQMLSIYGYDAKGPDSYGPGASGSTWALGIPPDVPNLLGLLACSYTSPPGCGVFPQYKNSTLWSGGGSGATTPAYISAPFDALLQVSIERDIALFWDFATVGATSGVDQATDACLVFINAVGSEGFDRSGLRDDFSDTLVENIASQCSNTIVTVHAAGPRLVDRWINHENVTAVIFGGIPGQDSGRALVRILFGQHGPSGKLPYTVAKNESDYGTLLNPSVGTGKYINFPQSDFSEGLFVDYRAFDKAGIEPRYEFGFGLTYTTFAFSNLQTQVHQRLARRGDIEERGGLSTYPTGKIIPGGHADLFDVVATVTANIKNTGSVRGSEVAQLYIQLPGDDQPVRQLRGFEKVPLEPGESAEVTFPLRRRDLSVWDVKAQAWALPNAEYNIWVGSSSRELPLKGTLCLQRTA